MSGMVDISDKKTVLREAVGRGTIKLKPSTVNKIRLGKIKKGDVLSTAQTAGILAVKKTAELIPLCHPIPVEAVNIELKLKRDKVVCECYVKARYTTGVEMECLVGVCAALLTVWDMVKYLEKDRHGQYPETKISDVVVVIKRKRAALHRRSDEKIM